MAITTSVSTLSAPPASAAAVPFATPPAIDPSLDRAEAVAIGDIDGDGRSDVVAAGFEDDAVFWYRNNGDGSFVKRPVSIAVNGAAAVALADIDGDGDPDVLAAALLDDAFLWFENDGAGGFTRHTVSADSELSGGALSVAAADVDGDGDLDVLGAAARAGVVAWYRNTGSDENFPATVISEDGSPRSLASGDFDRDGRPDIVYALTDQSGGIGHSIELALNRGGGFPDEPDARVSVDSEPVRPELVQVADLDGDNDLDVVAAWDSRQSGLRGAVYWYQNSGDLFASRPFVRRPVSLTAARAQSVATADIDGDGDLDILSASFEDNTVAWFDASPAAGSLSFVERVISADLGGAGSVAAADLDRDRDIDVVAAAILGDRVAWYRNDRLIDDQGPGATLLSAPDVGERGATRYTLRVRYLDASGIDPDSVDSGDLRISGPGGELTISAVAGDSGAGAADAYVYTAIPPGGSWDNCDDDGVYTIALRQGAVQDLPGNPAAAATLGSFRVATNGAPRADASAVDKRITSDIGELRFIVSAVDPDGDELDWAVAGAPDRGGSVRLEPDPAALDGTSSRQVVYRPTAGAGTDERFTLRAFDCGDAGVEVAVTVRISAPSGFNLPPDITGGSQRRVVLDGGGRAEFALNATDADSDPGGLVWSTVLAPGRGSLRQLSANPGATQTFRYQADTGTPVDRAVIQVEDSAGGVDSIIIDFGPDADPLFGDGFE